MNATLRSLVLSFLALLFGVSGVLPVAAERMATAVLPLAAERTSTGALPLAAERVPTKARGLPPLAVRAGLGSGLQGVDMPLSGVDVGTDTLRIVPNTPLYYIAAVAWRSLGLSARFTVPGSLDAIDERGSSEFTNLQLQVYRRQLAVDLVYQRHRGMYLTNGDELTTAPASLQLPAMELETIGVTAIWTRHEALHLAAMYRLNALPERSAVGLVGMAAASRVRLTAPNGPGATIAALQNTVWSNDMAIGSYSLIVGPGVAAIATVRSVFVAPLLSLGLGLQRSEYAVSTGNGVAWNVVPQLSVRVSAGVNARSWFAALVLTGDARNVQTPFLEATQTTTRVELVAGRRYRMTRWQGTRGISYR